MSNLDTFSTPRYSANAFIASDSAVEGDQSSPNEPRTYDPSTSRGLPFISPLPPIAHRKSIKQSASGSPRIMSSIKLKQSDGGLSSESGGSDVGGAVITYRSKSVNKGMKLDVNSSESPQYGLDSYRGKQNIAIVTPPSSQSDKKKSDMEYIHNSSSYLQQRSDHGNYVASNLRRKPPLARNDDNFKSRNILNDFDQVSKYSLSANYNNRYSLDSSNEYEFEYDYESSCKNQRRLKSRHRNSTIKSRKVKNSPLTTSAIRDRYNKNSKRPSLSGYSSSSDSNSGKECNGVDESSPISSRSLFSVGDSPTSSPLHVEMIKKKKYANGVIFNFSHGSFLRIFEQSYRKIIVVFCLLFCVTTVTVPTFFIQNNINTAYEVNNNEFGAIASRVGIIRKAHETTLRSPRIVILDNYLDYDSKRNLRKNPSDENINGRSHDYKPRVVIHRKVEQYPTEFSDNTQLYGVLDSADPELKGMEIREPYTQGECQPIADWQTTFHPSCNGMHEYDLSDVNEKATLFGKNGFWRNAWHLEQNHNNVDEHLVLKTLKYEHRFEDAHFEHDRVDAVAMDMLTASPHVINVFGFCGHSVFTEYADQPRIGTLADKSRKNPVKLLEIARDIANGLADVHDMGKDGDSSRPNSFVHLDINPANVVSIGGTLKLNDFNIGIMRKWNTTSNKPCGFPAQYPNPQVCGNKVF